MAAQLELDFSKRGNQLRTLAKCVLPSVKHRSRPISGKSLKAVLRGIDDCIGDKHEWQISLGKLCEQSGCSRSTVSGAIAILCEMSLINIRENYQVVDGRAEQEAHTYQIVWSNVQDFVAEAPARVEKTRAPVKVAVERGARTRDASATSETDMGSVSVGWGSCQSDMGVVSVCDGGSVSLGLPPCQTATLTAPLPPTPAKSRPFAVRPQTGFADKPWHISNSDFKSAVKSDDVAQLMKLQRMYLEALRCDWLKASEAMRIAFFAGCYEVTHQETDNAMAVLTHRVKNRSPSGGRGASNAAIDWARETIKRIDYGPRPVRTSDLSDRQSDEAINRERQFKGLLAMANGAAKR